MAATLVIVGLTLFLMGSVMLGRDAADRGRNTLLFVLPFIGFAYTRQHWSDVWWMAMMRVLGGTLLLIGLGIALAQNPVLMQEPERLFRQPDTTVMVGSKRPEMNTFANSEEAIRLAIRHDDNPVLTGRIHGEPFVYDRVQIVNGVISIQQGDGMLPEKEVRILMDVDIKNLTTRETWYVQPGDAEPPEIHLSWRERGADHPESRVIVGGYRLELQLARIDKEQFKGFLQLLLPDAHNSFLSGEFIANSNRLRYVGAEVDLSFDHPDTLEYVAEAYLETQFPEGVIKSVSFESTSIKIGSGTGSVIVIIELNNGQIERRELGLDRSDIGWAVTPGSMNTTVLRGPQSHNLRLVTREEAQATGTDQKQAPPPPVDLPREQLATLMDQEMTIEMVDGKTHKGILREIKRERARIEKILDAGVVQAWLPLAEMRGLTLKRGQVVNLTDVAQAVAEPAAEPAQTPAPAAPAAAEASQPDTPAPAQPAAPADPAKLAGFVNREVIIRDVQGKERQGLVTAVADGKVTLRVQVGSGSLNYYYDPESISSIKPAGAQ